MLKLHGLILDLDGLLIDSEVWSWKAHDTALALNGQPPLSLHDVRRLVGLAGHGEWRELRRMRDLPERRDKYDETFVAAFIAARDRNLSAMPGVHDLLGAAERLGLRVGLASNSPLSSIRAAIEGLGIAEHFSAVASGEEVPSGKPAPDVYRLALERLGLKADETIAIEDSQVGLRAATAAGLRCLAIPGEITVHQDFSTAYMRFASLAEAAAWLLEHAQRSETA